MLLAAPALIQLVLLLAAVLQRLPYPYDLEWMEGGILVHASRIADGSGIYVPPSLDFIPFLYTPLYPGLLALLQPFVGISYQVARGISLLSILGLVGLCFGAVVPRVDKRDRKAAVAGGIIATGFFCATYPWVDGWYDIARGDTLFLLMAAGGVAATSAWARTSWGWRGHARVAMAGALLALSFFCKQTGIFFVAAGGAIVLVKNWRRVPAFVGAAGVVGLGGTALLQRVTGGWFWTYAFKVHQTHDCNSDRFWHGFSEMLGKYPLMTATIAIGLALVAATAIVRRRLPRSAEPLLVWTWVFLVALVVGSVGIATQWSHRNAYIPAMYVGAVTAGAALPAILGTLTELLGERPRAREMAHAGAMLVLAALVVDLALLQRWSPGKFVPTARDRAAGSALIEQIRAVDGEVFIPFHPWYAHLAGKRVYTHRMGVLDMRYRPPARTAHECFFANPAGKPNWKVAGLPDAFARAYFAAVFWDNRDKNYFDGFERYYRLDDTIPRKERPRLFTGARDLVPTEILGAGGGEAAARRRAGAVRLRVRQLRRLGAHRQRVGHAPRARAAAQRASGPGAPLRRALVCHQHARRRRRHRSADVAAVRLAGRAHHLPPGRRGRSERAGRKDARPGRHSHAVAARRAVGRRRASALGEQAGAAQRAPRRRPVDRPRVRRPHRSLRRRRSVDGRLGSPQRGRGVAVEGMTPGRA